MKVLKRKIIILFSLTIFMISFTCIVSVSIKPVINNTLLLSSNEEKNIKLSTDDFKEQYNEDINTVKIAIVALIVAGIVATGICLIIIYSYKDPKSISSINYVNKDLILLKKDKDTFINTYTIRTKIEKNNNIDN